MFLDEVTITARGGAGGRGAVSWRREKYIPKGGPDGGDGGNGGSVRLVADDNTDTLSAFASRKVFTAADGKTGKGKKCHGRNGEDLTLKVPPGSLVFVATACHGEEFADLQKDGDAVTIAKGGRGGYGNAHFVNSYRQRPDFAELGEPGEERCCTLELKLIADIGIIGLPNVGKSTLITAISSARPRIADYPFTTIVPNLGVVKVAGTSYIVCDIPGIIGGASAGKGLGISFLRHVERCGILLHLLDCSRGGNLADDYHTLRKELAAHSPLLAEKKELVMLNKTDLLTGSEEREKMEARLRKEEIPIFATISAATKTGTEELKHLLLPLALAERQNRQRVTSNEQTSTIIPILRPHETSPRASAYQIHQEGPEVHIRGKRLEQIVAMTDTKNASAVRRLRHIFDRIGLSASLRALKLSKEHAIYIGKIRIEHLL